MPSQNVQKIKPTFCVCLVCHGCQGCDWLGILAATHTMTVSDSATKTKNFFLEDDSQIADMIIITFFFILFRPPNMILVIRSFCLGQCT